MFRADRFRARDVAVMIRRLACLVIAFAPALAAADGFVTINGKLGGGHEVIVDPETASVWLWHRSRAGEITQAREFKDQGCALVYDDANPKRVRRILTCAPGGSTPLAGTRYVGRPAGGDCWKGDPEFVYTCTQGCGAGSRAPKRMTQNHWEC